MADKDLKVQPDMFLCFLCERYKDAKGMKQVVVAGDLQPKMICITCYEKVQTGGLSKAEATRSEEPKPKLIKSEVKNGS